ncbi:MAG TPA: HU family DNA-binding protein [Blastocatellia bacterium]|nr:HU family DNA-binding protein [Blastocatellia bacterium]
MTKAELVEEVARAAELNKRDAEVIVETVFDSIIGALHKGEKVELRGFGSFRTRERGPRRGRNPKTGEPVDVPAKRVPYFKPGKELKEYFTDEPGEGAGAGTGTGEATGEGTGLIAPGVEVAPAASTESQSANEGGAPGETGGSGDQGAGGEGSGAGSASGDAGGEGSKTEGPTS